MLNFQQENDHLISDEQIQNRISEFVQQNKLDVQAEQKISLAQNFKQTMIKNISFKGLNAAFKAVYISRLTYINKWLAAKATTDLTRSLTSITEIAKVTGLKSLTSSSTWMGAAACLVLGIGFDIVKFLRSDRSEQNKKICINSISCQFVSFLPSIICSTVGSTIGAIIGTLILPGWGTFLGNIIGGFIGVLCGHYIGQKLIYKKQDHDPQNFIQQAFKFFSLPKNTTIQRIKQKARQHAKINHPDSPQNINASDQQKILIRQKFTLIMTYREVLIKYAQFNNK